MSATETKDRAHAEALAERVELLRGADKHRDWRAESVTVDEVHPTDAEMHQFIEGADASLAGLGDLVTDLRHGKYPGPMTLVDRGKDGLWLDASTHDLVGSNSLALLIALRQVGEEKWLAAVYKDKAQKDEEDDEEEEYALTAVEKQAARDHLTEFILGVMAGITLISEDDLFSIASEGARFGGGGLNTGRIKGIAREALEFNDKYMARFKGDALVDMEELLAGSYLSAERFVAEADALMNAIANRAENYAAGGNLAWVRGIGEAAKENGYPGCLWNCTFGPGSCTDCISLHGQYMEWDEFYETFGETQCNGGCNCGPQAAEGPGEVPEDLNTEEAVA